MVTNVRIERGGWAAVTVVVAILALPLLVGGGTAPVGAAVIGCNQASSVLVLTGDTELDPACTYTGGIRIAMSDVSLDCKGALISGPPSGGSRGILIHAPTTEDDLTDITVRNCEVEGWLNSIRVTRDGFRDLPAGGEYEHGFSNVLIENNTFHDSRGVGVYVDGYVTGVTIRNNLITRTGSSGIYLETGSTGSAVLDNEIRDNGYRENGPVGQAFSFGGLDLWFWGVGREGISVDGSRLNTIRGNHLEGNSAGGIFLYKNCGEYPDRPRYFERRHGATGNVIEANTFVGGTNGVWVGSRMAENTLPMDCTDPAYIDEALRRVVLDYASDNVVRGNSFDGVTYGVRVEDDDVTVEGNSFHGGPDDHAVIIGTPLRTAVLGQPVDGTVVRQNTSSIADNPSPYRWIHGHTHTTDEDNVALGRTVALCQGQELPRSAFIFVIEAVPWDGVTPPEKPAGLSMPVLGPLPPCSGDANGSPSIPTTTAPSLAAAPAQAIRARPTFTG